MKTHIATLPMLAILTLSTISCKKGSTPAESAKPSENAVRKNISEPAQMALEFETLKGRWQRPDGGYVLELREILENNTLNVAYFNPSPINVGEAKIYKENGFTKVFVKLQDQNYPGSTYNLIYDKENDLLRGIYFQATYGQEYQIEFVRMPKE